MDALKPYVNLINMGDTIRELHWCNDAIYDALNYYRHMTGNEIDLAVAIQFRQLGHLPFAFLYGALKASEDISLQAFRYLTVDQDDVLSAVEDGLHHYLPEPGKTPTLTEEDMTWPEINPVVETKPFDFFPVQLELKQAGYSLAEIGRMTLRATNDLIHAIRGVPVGDDDWILGKAGEEDGAL